MYVSDNLCFHFKCIQKFPLIHKSQTFKWGVSTIYYVTNQASTFAPVSLIDKCIFFTFSWLRPSRSVFLSLSVSNNFQSNFFHILRYVSPMLSSPPDLNWTSNCYTSYLEAICALSSTPALITSNLTNVHSSPHQQDAPISW